MYSIFTMQAIVTAAVFHAAVAQVPFQLICPDAGFTDNEVNTVECTVRGSDVTGASCAVAVSSIRLETVDAGVPKSIAHSPFPTCDNNWSSVNNDNGRCTNRDTITDVYTYQFNVTADRAILTNLTGLRCFAECSGGPGVGNPFAYNSSKTCGPPVIFAKQTTTAPPSTSGSVPPTSFTSQPETPQADEKTKDNCEDDCIGGSVSGGIGGTMMIVGGVVAVFWSKKIKVYVGYPREQITRIDLYAKRLHTYKKELETELRKKMNCCVRCDVSIDGNRAIQADDSPKKDTDHLHVLVKLSKITSYNKMQDISLAVAKFVKKHIRKEQVRDVIVLENATIPEMDDIGKRTKTNIYPEGSIYQAASAEQQRLLTVNENCPPEYVIQIEGATVKAVEDAEKEVKDLLHNPTFDRTFLVPEDIKKEVREYIEEKTGTTIFPLPGSITIKGSNKTYTEQAGHMVLDFLKKNVQMVVLPENYPIKLEAIDKIRQKMSDTRTTLLCPVENGKGHMVLQIEGPNKKECDKAANEVKALFVDDAPPSACCSFCRTEAPPAAIV